MARRSRRGGRRHRRAGPPPAVPAAPVERRELPTTTEMLSLSDLLALLRHESPEIQCAAARVIGALKIDSPVAREHLLDVLNFGPNMVRSYAMDAIQCAAAETPLEQFVGMLGTSPELTKKASDLLLKEGGKALPMLAERIAAGGNDEFARAALQTIQRIGTEDAAHALVDLVPKLSPDLQRFALDQIMAVLPSLTAPQRAGLREDASARLRKSVDEPTTVTILRLLGRMRDPDSLDLLLSFVGKDALAVVAAAVGGVHNLGEIPERDHAAVFQKLHPALDHEDYDQIVRPALQTLERIPVKQTMAPTLQKLAKSEHRSVRAYALQALGKLGSGKAVGQLMDALSSAELKVAEAARSALGSNKVYVQPLVAKLRAAKTPEEAWNVGRILQRQRADIPKSVLSSLANDTVTMIGSQSPLFQAYFELLRSAAPELLRETFYEKGVALFAKEKFREAADVLRHLDRHDLASGDSDLLLAMARIAMGQKDPTRAARDRHPGLLLLGRIARRSDYDPIAGLKKIKSDLNPDDLLFAGFYLVERTGVDRALGGELLKFIVAGFRSSKAAETAAARLKTERIR